MVAKEIGVFVSVHEGVRACAVWREFGTAVPT